MTDKKLAVGHFFNGDFTGVCAAHLPRIKEVFFAWPGVLSCRPANDCAHCGKCAALLKAVYHEG